ncbi:hypothetical protein L2Y94_14400 [Luteibacter aegosomatis]|uniref:hypothetical protein n=1 Tax=Luteibacter aegosomatis TaxID=2911537 RepID=UPI001FF868C6|nr:hypothetical protein [Luteibacter aegosomatis]UPG84522.1 hypothetical protein L2Y94_14400 [Luteibacter aegosomatis]
MLERTTKMPGNSETEKDLAVLAEQVFKGLWSYPSIQRDTGLSTSGTGKEVIDLLLYFENDVVLFSDKKIGFPIHPDIAVAWQRWYGKSVTKSVEQLCGAEKYIRKSGDRLFLDVKCQNPFHFDLRRDGLTFHLVAVTYNTVNPCRTYQSAGGERSDGSLAYNFGVHDERMVCRPFIIPNLNATETFVHVLDEISRQRIFEELPTATDFIHYLDEKEKAVRSGRLNGVHCESDILSNYLSNRVKDDFNISDNVRYVDDSVTVGRGDWLSYTSSKEFLTWKEKARDAQPWNELVQRFSGFLLEATISAGREHGMAPHEKTLRYLASESIYSRAYLSDFMVNKRHEIDGFDATNQMQALVAVSPMKKRRAYVFVFTSSEKWGGDCTEYRKESEGLMGACFRYLMLSRPDYDEVITIAIDPVAMPQRPHTIIAFDVLDEPITERELEDARRLWNNGIADLVWFS